MSERTVVMISSTARDLPEHRREAMGACMSLDCVPKMMEHLPAVDADAIKASLDLVDQAHVYLGIFAYRYGYIPKGHDISITEMELSRAQERQIPCLILFIHEDHPVTGKDVEKGKGADKLEALKARLGSERVAGFFRSPEDLRAEVFQSLVAHRDKLRDEARGGAEPAPSTGAEVERPPPSIEDNPYRSLSAFHEKDASVFFGRDTLIKETLARFYGLIGPSGTVKTRLLAILGPSGSGKSSFARAGLAARLNQKAKDDQTGLRVFTFVPGEHPMETLTDLVQTKIGGDATPPDQAAEPTLRQNETKEPFPSPLAQLPESGPIPLVLLVDQFEEVYSLCRNEREQTAFIEALVTASKKPKARVSVILTMRSDFLGETQRHSELNTAIAKHSLIVPAMSAEDLRLAITGPASRAGYPLDEPTVGRLIDDTIGHEGVLPLLQFVLTEIWRGMASGIAPADTVTKLGGVGGALANQAEELYQKLEEPDQHIARRAFLGMVHLGEGAQDTRRRVPVKNLIASDDPDHVLEVLNQFAKWDRRLVTLSEEAKQPVAEVTHEALFSHWGTLQHWLDKGRDDIRFQRRLEEAANEWAAADKDDQPGFLWRPPRLSLLDDYHKEHSGDMRPVDLAFYEASQNEQKRERDEKQKRIEEKEKRAEEKRLAEARLAEERLNNAEAQRLADERLAAEKLTSQQARTRLFRILTILMSTITLAATGAVGFFAFATVHGLDPSETFKALMIRANMKTVPIPEMVTIQPGEPDFPASYLMGSDEGEGEGDERPVHRVTIKAPFAIGKFEVTFDEYVAFVDATTDTARPDDAGWGRDNRPAIYVSWRDAQAYVKWLSAVTGDRYRLPSESEWEYVARACRGPEPKCWRWHYWWGNKHDQSWANCDRCGATWIGKTAAVDDEAFKPNGFGLYHTAGNVWEWVEDCWHDDYNGSPPVNGKAWKETDGGFCDKRVIRGGSWESFPEELRSANRDKAPADNQYYYIGFRLAQDIH